jgi:phenylpyruvate tautomerase PptA (4-oxalocrotonate tautomerase family)
MPMIELTVPEGALTPEATDTLADTLTATLLRIEGAPDNELFRSIAWVYVSERPAGRVYVGGKPGAEPVYRTIVTIPEGALNDERKSKLVEEMTAQILEAAGEDPGAVMRVWVLINEVPDGNWGGAGQVVRFKDLVAMAKAAREPATA